MKTAVFIALLKRLAKSSMPQGEYEAFSNKVNIMRWQRLKRDFPEIWDSFSERFAEIKEQLLGASADPETMVDAIAPGSIHHYPEIFEPFKAQLEQIKSGMIYSDTEQLVSEGGDFDGDHESLFSELKEAFEDFVEGFFS